MSNEPVSVRILDREYTVGVTAEERESLTAAARLLGMHRRSLQRKLTKRPSPGPQREPGR